MALIKNIGNCFSCKKEIIKKRLKNLKNRYFCSRKCSNGSENNPFCRKTYIPWHKGKKIPELSMEKSSRWGGGKINQYGYTLIRQKGGFYIREHVLEMKKHIGRFLKKKEVVHHWNEKKDDNRIENLCLFRTQAAHKRLHHFAKRNGLKIEALKFCQSWLI